MNTYNTHFICLLLEKCEYMLNNNNIRNIQIFIIHLKFIRYILYIFFLVKNDEILEPFRGRNIIILLFCFFNK